MGAYIDSMLGYCEACVTVRFHMFVRLLVLTVCGGHVVVEGVMCEGYRLPPRRCFWRQLNAGKYGS